MPMYDKPVYDEDILSIPVYDKAEYDEDILSMSVHDKPVYDEDVFNKLPGLMNNSPPPSVKFDYAVEDEGVAFYDDEIPPEKTITVSSLVAPELAPRRGGLDELFAWLSTEFLRKLCIGKEVTFRVDYTVPSFGYVFLGDTNVALLVVAGGGANVREQGQQKGEASLHLADLLRLDEQAKQQGLGRWNRTQVLMGRPIRTCLQQLATPIILMLRLC
ncbi:hypothetical protein SASPL_114976 [Salvia splendens]|uniref:TNase-like domain-containing protein n=1 Tax=Salvia splendens TaxID=180675 RepID=A0A8X9A172_SALSN|nr:hypothetical protein SASPL_114976 [Salvia splendens]